MGYLLQLCRAENLLLDLTVRPYLRKIRGILQDMTQVKFEMPCLMYDHVSVMNKSFFNTTKITVRCIEHVHKTNQNV